MRTQYLKMTGSDRFTLLEGWALEVLIEMNSTDLDLDLPNDWKRAIKGAIKKLKKATEEAGDRDKFVIMFNGRRNS